MAVFDDTLDMAKTQVALSALRYGHFPADIFDEYGWDMLLHLYIAGLRRQTLYVDDLINLTSKNHATGMRWITYLQNEKMIEVDGDGIRLSDAEFQRMNVYHEDALTASR